MPKKSKYTEEETKYIDYTFRRLNTKTDKPEGKKVYEHTDLPALGFNFKVTSTYNNGISGIINKFYGPDETFFQKVSGMNANSEPETVFSGGDNNKQYKLPNATTFSDLKLQRGIVKKNSPMGIWCNSFLIKGNSNGVQTKTVNVMLMDTDQETVLMTWSFNNCYPKSIEIGDFNAQESAFAIETLTLCYSDFKRDIT